MKTAPNKRLIPGTIAHSAVHVATHGVFDGIGSNAYPMASGSYADGSPYVVDLVMRGEHDEMRFADAVVSISRERNIVATPVLEGKGTVKELITEGDITLNIKVTVVSTSIDGDYDGYETQQYDMYPYAGVERLMMLLDEPNRLDIVSDFLRMLDLDGGDFGIVVKGYSMSQETHTNCQTVNITAVSDYDYNLLIEG